MSFNIPKISIIIVSKSRKNYLRDLISSLSIQTFIFFEVIIIDNASDIYTKEFIESIFIKNISIKKVFLAEEQTVSYCRNYPFRNSLVGESIEYIYFVDDDDALLSNTLEVFYRAFKNSKAQVVCGNPLLIFHRGNIFENTYKYIGYLRLIRNIFRGFWFYLFGEKLFRSNFWLLIRHLNCGYSIHCFMFTRDLFYTYAFQDNITYGEDSLLLYEISPLVKTAVYLPFTYILYRRHGDNTSDIHNISKKVKSNPFHYQFCETRYSASEIFIGFFPLYLKAISTKYRDSEQIYLAQKFYKHQLNSSLILRIKVYIFYMPQILFYALRFSISKLVQL